MHTRHSDLWPFAGHGVSCHNGKFCGQQKRDWNFGVPLYCSHHSTHKLSVPLQNTKTYKKKTLGIGYNLDYSFEPQRVIKMPEVETSNMCKNLNKYIRTIIFSISQLACSYSFIVRKRRDLKKVNQTISGFTAYKPLLSGKWNFRQMYRFDVVFMLAVTMIILKRHWVT